MGNSLLRNMTAVQGRQSLPKSGGRGRPSDVEAFPPKVFFLKCNVHEMPFPAF